jgi:predicted transcriptional regulator
MTETTVHLPEELEVRLDALSAATGVSRAELVLRAIALLLDHAERPKQSRELPVFDSGRPLTPDEMDESVYEHMKERVARR